MLGQRAEEAGPGGPQPVSPTVRGKKAAFPSWTRLSRSCLYQTIFPDNVSLPIPVVLRVEGVATPPPTLSAPGTQERGKCGVGDNVPLKKKHNTKTHCLGSKNELLAAAQM